MIMVLSAVKYYLHTSSSIFLIVIISNGVFSLHVKVNGGRFDDVVLLAIKDGSTSGNLCLSNQHFLNG